MRSREDQYNSTYCISSCKTVVNPEDSCRYDFLQWHIIARGKLKFSSPISFPLNTKTMSADIWHERLCIWVLFFPLHCCFTAFIFLLALPGRSSEEGIKTTPINSWWKQNSPSPSCFSVLTPDVSSWCLQINTHTSSKTECCSSGRFMPFHIVLNGVCV